MATRLKGRQMDYLGDIPTFLYDLKDGEILVASDGIYARYGTQIRKHDFDSVVSVSTTTTMSTTTSTTSSSSTTSTIP